MHPDETEWKEELLKQRGVTNWPDVLAKVSAAELEVATERSATARRAVVASKTKKQRRSVPGRLTSELESPHALARMRGLLGEI